MIDILEQINAIHRQVNQTGEEVIVLMRRTYPAEPEEVWDALTDPERLRRWFLPVSGELKVGGSFQLEGNAGGDILECEQPKRFKVTFGGPTSLVEVRLTPGPDQTTEFELEHSVSADMAGGAVGALYVGPGWDGALLGLAIYLAGEIEEGHDPQELANSPEALKFSEQSVRAWLQVVRESGAATEEEIMAAAQASLAQFAPGGVL
ncbi:SRPBCC family protein [Kribbella alba]|uniref:SRPBCC family protein n=1 Tax=Kribbella alba TaxID=190197 RepID=A0ABN2F3E6_9ACTN